MSGLNNTGLRNTWQIGDFTVSRIVEMEVAGGTRFILPDATRDAASDISWLNPHFADDDGNLIMSIHALVIDTGDQRIIVDTCIGNDKPRNVPNWNNLQTSFLQDLEAAGYPRESIDTVLCTHLHVDHVGWNTMLVNGEWVPTFPNARYLLAQKEFDYWMNGGIGDDEDAYGDVLGDSVQPVVDAGLVDLVDWEHAGPLQCPPAIQWSRSAHHRRLHSSSLSDDASRLVQQRGLGPERRPGHTRNAARQVRRLRCLVHRHSFRHANRRACKAPGWRRLLARCG
jgi:hypothetical protein